MLFNSFSFALFFPIVFIFYWFVFKKSLKYQNFFLVICSYFFYGYWDWRFVFLLAFSTALDFFSGIQIAKVSTKAQKKFWLILSVSVNLGFLGFFKYYNFFIESFAELLTSIGFTPHYSTLRIILPVGISFYTFHGLSYVFDIYNEKIKPSYNWVNYTLFVCFFPLLVAGPIERATHLLPQVEKERTFSYSKAVDGLRQILWGLFKKIVVADNCANFVNPVFANSEQYPGPTLALGVILFAIQIYGDFSGYSDIALGTARILGIELLQNFRFPYFSRDIAEFWRRWHISLTTWFRDYLYIPLGGSRVSKMKVVRNTFIIFVVSGFWHGANWTFIAWGMFHAILFLPLILMNKNRKYTNTVAEGKLLPDIKEIFQMGLTFFLVVIGWVFFRADTIGLAFEYLRGMANISSTFLLPIDNIQLLKILFVISCMLIVEWFDRKNHFGLEKLGITWTPVFRYALYYFILLLIFFSMGKEQVFIYFQF